MRKIFRALAGTAMSVAMALSSLSGMTVMAASPSSIDVTKAEFVEGYQAVDAKDFTEIVFSVYEYKDQLYAYVHKGDEDAFFAEVEISDAEYENMTNCKMYSMADLKYVVGSGELEDCTLVLRDNDGFIGFGKEITEKESLADINSK